MHRLKILVLALLTVALPSWAHVGQHPSVHDTVANIIERMKKDLPREKLEKLNAAQALQFLTSKEREILGTEHISFKSSVPVVVSVVTAPKTETPFWLSERGFQKSSVEWMQGTNQLTVWQKDFPAGWIGLGVNSLGGGGTHYLLSVGPKTAGERAVLSDFYPGQLRSVPLEPGVKAFTDQATVLTNVPPSLAGNTLLQTQHARRDAAKLLGVLRWTEHPSSLEPDQVILTWSGNPQTTQTIQWRTSPRINRSYVRFQEKAGASPLLSRKSPVRQIAARMDKIVDLFNANDPVMHHHTVTLKALKPGTTYSYVVGSGPHWSAPAEFTTAPDRTVPFSFVYMGDAQNGLDRWGSLLQNAFRRRPDAAFYIMAGDLVNRGAERDDWDSLFYNARGVYDHRQLVPVIGNHENQGGHPSLYLKFFELPTNGPTEIEKERGYSFEYSNALFVVLDSNLDPAKQTNWLEKTLADSKATWKFVTYHHPAYSSGPSRDNEKLRQLWTPIFDKYHVDMALQGHDHAYLRTYPMLGEKRVKSPAEGTVYIVSVSGTKMYSQAKHDYTEFGMTNVATYQVLDIQISGDRLIYRAYDIDGTLRDELIIEKPAK